MEITWIIILASLLLNVENMPQPSVRTMQIFGNSTLGYYYVNLYAGKPSQIQSVILDTGSDILTMPCSKCLSCGKKHINDYFKFEKSSSSKFLTCTSNNTFCESFCHDRQDRIQACPFNISYLEGSQLNGIYLEDYIHLQQNDLNEAVKIQFGCTTFQSHLFATQKANGIFGLFPGKSFLFQQIFKQHSKTTHQKFQFALCLAKNGGFLTVGGSNHTYHTEEPISTTFTTSMNTYSMQNVGNFKIGKKIFHQTSDNPGPYGVYVDSGTTYTGFPKKQMDIFVQQINKICTQQSSQCQIVSHLVDQRQCYHITPKKLNESNWIVELQNWVDKIFPPMQMELNRKIIKWNSTEYFVIRKRKKMQICLGITQSDSIVLGGNWMVNKDVLFNNEQNVIKIYPNSNCSLAIKALNMAPMQQQDDEPITINQFLIPIVISGIGILIVLGYLVCKYIKIIVNKIGMVQQVVQQKPQIESYHKYEKQLLEKEKIIIQGQNMRYSSSLQIAQQP